MNRKQPNWSEAVKQGMGRIETVLARSSDEQAAIDRLKDLQRLLTLMQRYGARRCDPIASMLAHVGNYWGGGVLLILSSGSLRPSTLQRLMTSLVPDHPISMRMLRLNLRTLEQDGLIEREVYASRRAHVEYRLTELGQGLCSQIRAVVEWSADNFDQIVAARAAFAARTLRDARSYRVRSDAAVHSQSWGPGTGRVVDPFQRVPPTAPREG